MRLNHEFEWPEKRPQKKTFTSVHFLIKELIDSRETSFQEANITIEAELADIDAEVDTAKIHSAINALLDHSLVSMPSGGQLCISLLDCDLHWELEIADTAGIDPLLMQSIAEREQQTDALKKSTEDLPTIELVRSSDQLSLAKKVAVEHQGQLQTWDCPDGGKAHVLVIPHRQTHRDQA